MKKQSLHRSALLLLFALFLSPVWSQVKMDYTISIDTLQHYVNVTLHASNLEGVSTQLKMPVWAPGYYRIMDYPVNVVDFKATADGKELKTEKQGKNAWNIRHSVLNKEMTVTYQVYANDQSVASAQVESTRAFLPLNGILMYVNGQKESPVDLKVEMPSNWQKITTGLDSTGRNQYHAQNFDVIYDSPLLLGNYYTTSFQIDGVNYDFAVENPDGLDKWPLIEDLKKVIRTAKQMMGGIPYEHYAFLLLKPGNGGLEHQGSQASFMGRDFNFKNRDAYLRILSFITHEYFHCYNVKAIRPIELTPFDYDKECFTTGLWVSEGFTVYYESKLLQMAGIITEEERLQKISGFIEEIETHEGQKHQSLRQFSYDIFLNFFNWGPQGTKTTVSYYEKGPVIGLLLDIDIQRATQGKKSLNDLMALLYKRFYVELKRGFTEEELWKAFEEVAGKPLTETRHLVDTTDPIPYDTYLDYIGCHLTKDYKITK